MGEEQVPQTPAEQPLDAPHPEGGVSDALHKSLTEHPIGGLPGVPRLHPKPEAPADPPEQKES